MRRSFYMVFLVWAGAFSALASVARADALDIVVSGIEGAPADNIKAHVGSNWIPSVALSTPRRRARFLDESKNKAAAALRPYGYYFPSVQARLEPAGDEQWSLHVAVAPGPPLTVRKLQLELRGEGAAIGPLQEWRAAWPLPEGARVDQTAWDLSKEDLIDRADQWGYLNLAFIESRIAIDLEQNVADLSLVIDTGPRAVMGAVEFRQDLVEEYVLVPVPRFEPGTPYRAFLVERLRTDLWKTGYFDQVDVVEKRRLDQAPPVVDFQVTLTARKPATHQATLGYGTDSEFRTQYRWTRHRLSHRGDSLSLATGWQQRFNELLVSSEYRLPRETKRRESWVLGAAFKRERVSLDLALKPGQDPIARGAGSVEDYAFRAGRAKLRNLADSRELLVESVFAEYLFERFNLSLDPPNGGPGELPPEVARRVEQALGDDDQESLIVGMDWDWPVIRGQGFQTTGHHERAWVFHSDTAWGSDRSFSQVYLQSRWSVLLSPRIMLQLRGEAGYSNARLRKFSFEQGGETLTFDITSLPNLYRFKAGGSSSVRGYDFEELSDSGLGANNILTASVELEYNFKGDWSAAAFYDIGNAFNHWDDPGLQSGVGVGLRWYTIAGAIRVDVASALDREGDPWTFHITIGTPLL